MTLRKPLSPIAEAAQQTMRTVPHGFAPRRCPDCGESYCGTCDLGFYSAIHTGIGVSLFTVAPAS